MSRLGASPPHGPDENPFISREAELPLDVSPESGSQGGKERKAMEKAFFRGSSAGITTLVKKKGVNLS